MSSAYSLACCSRPPVTSNGYVRKGDFQTLSGVKTYITGPPSSKNAILVVYDIFGFSPQTLQGADLLAFHGNRDTYRVFIPDFFEGKAADIAWYPPKNEKHSTALGNFFEGVGNPAKAVARMSTIVKDIRKYDRNVEHIFALGMCWGGKVVTLCSGADSPFKATAQVHPAMLNRTDAKAVTIPMCILASKDEDGKEVSAFRDNLQVPNHVETFHSQIHGWMGARGDLADQTVREEYARGYAIVQGFFATQLIPATTPSYDSGRVYHVVMWSLKNSSVATQMLNLIRSLPASSKKDGQTYILETRSGLTKPPRQGRPSRAQGYNLISVLVFQSEADLLFFGTEDTLHHQMVTLAQSDEHQMPLVASFTDGNSILENFMPHSMVGGS